MTTMLDSDVVALPAPGSSSKPVETVVLFSIGDREFRIPSKPKVNTSLRYLRNVRTLGEDRAASELLAELLGEEGFNALADYDDLTADQFTAVVRAAQKHVLGSLEDNRGNSARG